MADEKKRLEIINKDGVKYVRIDPYDIDTSKMTLVKKITDVVAGQVQGGKTKVVTKHGRLVETINYAKAGDWVVYDIGASDFKRMIDKLLNCERAAITKENFAYLYMQVDEDLGLKGEDELRLIQELIMDNDDNKEFDSSFIHKLKRYKYIGKPVYAGYVPFNFVLRAPWMEDQFIKRGGLVIYDTNFERQRVHKHFDTEQGRKDYERENGLGPNIFGIEGAKDRVPGIFEKTYSLAPGSEKTIIADTFKMAIQADRSPIAGIQFNNRDLAHAYERAGKHIPGFLQKFLKD